MISAELNSLVIYILWIIKKFSSKYSRNRCLLSKLYLIYYRTACILSITIIEWFDAVLNKRKGEKGLSIGSNFRRFSYNEEEEGFCF